MSAKKTERYFKAAEHFLLVSSSPGGTENKNPKRENGDATIANVNIKTVTGRNKAGTVFCLRSVKPTFKTLAWVSRLQEAAMSYMATLRRHIGNSIVLCPSVAAVIHNGQTQILLQEKAPGEPWSLPAGGIELGESPQEAIVREVMEETGLLVTVRAILGVFGGVDFRYTYPNGDMVEYVVTLFECQIEGQTTSITDPETKSLRYFSKEEMPGLALPYPSELLFGASS